MIKFLPCALLVVTLACKTVPGAAHQGDGDSLRWVKVHFNTFDFYYTSHDSAIAEDLVAYTRNGEQSVKEFFGHSFKNTFSVYVFPQRNALDHQWQSDWGDTSFHSECWMVASGVGDRLDLLSPLKWSTEACDHSSSDRVEIQRLITHELVHVFHGQQNPKPDFAGMDDLAWLIEGTATYASGQLSESRRAAVRALVAEGKAPLTLANFWSGKNKYGLAGSLMQYIDVSYGRSKLFHLLSYSDQQSILSLLQTDETLLIANWRKYILR